MDCSVKFIKLLFAVFLKYLSMKNWYVSPVIVFVIYIISSSGQGFGFMFSVFYCNKIQTAVMVLYK